MPAGYIPTAVATADFNGDGNPDFIVASGGDNTLWLYLGKGDGTFNLPIILPITKGQTPMWIAAADLRGIGKMDIIVAEPDSNSVGVFLGNGDGTFVESSIGVGGSAYALAVGDFNHDGKLDIVTATSSQTASPEFVTLPGNGDGTFGARITTPGVAGVFWLSTADLNGDGSPDLVESTALVDEEAVQVFLSNGDGTFSPGQAIAQNYAYGPVNLGSVLVDADEDGQVDALVADTFGTLWFYHGNGDGTFSTNPTTFPIGDVPFGMTVADVNGDGHMDVVLSGTFVNDLLAYGVEAGDQICVLEGDGKGNFSFPTVYRGDSSSYALATGDFNKDGHPDFVTANQYNDSATVFLNDGLGGFGSPQGGYLGYDYGPVNAPMSGAVITDVDGDGSPDVALMEYQQSPDNYYAITVLLNDGKGSFSAPIHSDAVNSNFNTFGDFVLADFRNTGLPDFLAIAYNYTSSGQFISFAPNIGGGHFGPPVTTTPANALGVIGVGDFNRDGKLDFVAAGFCGVGGGNCLQVFNGNGDGTFGTGYMQTFAANTSAVPAAVYVGDFNRDGKLDLLVFLEANNGWTLGDNVYEFFGNGDGTFQPAILLFSHFGPMVVADVNGDGYPDIVNMLFPIATNGLAQPVQFSIYLGQADGSFALTNTYAPYGYGGFLAEAPVGTIQYFAPMVADFNGDGKLDIAAFQSDGNLNRDTFVQFMLGNGDGTFTPTYDVLDLRKTWFEGFAADLRGTGRSDLFELNGYRSTYDLIQSVTAAPFQFAMIDDPVVGNAGSAILLLDVPSPSSTTFSTIASDPAITVSPTVTIPSGQVSKTFNFTVGSGFNRNHVFSITASAGGNSAVVYASVVRSGSAGFQAQATEGLSWPNVNVAAGQTVSDATIEVQAVNGYASTLSFSCLGLAQEAQCQFTPPSVDLRSNDYSSSRWGISVNPGTSIGSYPVTIRATDGMLTQDIPFTLNVGDFSLALAPPTIQVFPTGFASTTLTLSSVNQFNQTVNLSCGGLPSGATCAVTAFDTPMPGGKQDTVGIQTQSVPTGNYQVTITGTSPPVTHTATAQVQVWDFAASVSPTTASVNAGGSANFTVTITSVNEFTGAVNLFCSSNTALVSCAFNSNSVTVPASGTATSTLTLTASSQLASRREDRRRRLSGTLAVSVTLPLGILMAACVHKRRTKLGLLLLMVIFGLSCGGGNNAGGAGGGSGGGGGGGGGGSSQTYSITVNVGVPDGSYTKAAGTIKLAVN